MFSTGDTPTLPLLIFQCFFENRSYYFKLCTTMRLSVLRKYWVNPLIEIFVR